jgi:hypothetical protein
MDVNGTGMVWVSVTMFDQGRTCMLPVMDYRNKPISNPDAFQVNTSIMRCMTKAIALHGLGLYIYANEDLPEGAADVAFKQEQQEKVEKIITKAIAKVVDGVPSDDASRELFAEAMIEYADKAWHVQSTNDLQGYWKSNQVQLDALKVSHPDLYEKVKNHFTELKLKFKQQKENI